MPGLVTIRMAKTTNECRATLHVAITQAARVALHVARRTRRIDIVVTGRFRGRNTILAPDVVGTPVRGVAWDDGHVRAFDLKNGRRLWNFDVIPSQGPALETWPADQTKVRAGGGMYSSRHHHELQLERLAGRIMHLAVQSFPRADHLALPACDGACPVA